VNMNYKKKMLLLLFVMIIGLMTACSQNKEEISKEFAQQLFTYPTPSHTKILKKEQDHGEKLVPGNGGQMGVVASVELSTTLSKEEVISYYQKAGLFTYPNSDKKGVELELYFGDDLQKVQELEGYYFRTKDGKRKFPRSYGNEHSSEKVTKYVIQLTSDFEQ